MEGRAFGEFFKGRRIALGLTLRGFCEKHGLDAGNISKIERGMLPPPKSENLLHRYADFLALRKGSDGWYEFFNLAAAEAGRLPRELMNEDIMKRMPVLFRTIRGKKISKKKLDKLIELIKES